VVWWMFEGGIMLHMPHDFDVLCVRLRSLLNPALWRLSADVMLKEQ